MELLAAKSAALTAQKHRGEESKCDGHCHRIATLLIPCYIQSPPR
jgi:hypothetical protein